MEKSVINVIKNKEYKQNIPRWSMRRSMFDFLLQKKNKLYELTVSYNDRSI